MPSVGVEGVSPIYFVRGLGSQVWDLEGKEFIDFTMGLSPCILGYNHPKIKEAVLKQLESEHSLLEIFFCLRLQDRGGRRKIL